MITSDFITCDSIEPSTNGARELNYPSIMVATSPGHAFKAEIPRTVTNVGDTESTYKAIISAPSGITVTVVPDTLSFSLL